MMTKIMARTKPKADFVGDVGLSEPVATKICYLCFCCLKAL